MVLLDTCEQVANAALPAARCDERHVRPDLAGNTIRTSLRRKA
jgi:hypothetical protein